jgi:hypothetical protein
MGRELIPTRVWIGGALALLGGLAVGLAAVSAKAPIESDILIYYTQPDILNGQVTSPEPTCMPKRRVNVFKKKSGPDKKIASDETNHGGYYQRHFNGKDGIYYSKAKERPVAAGLCRRDSSNEVTVP